MMKCPTCDDKELLTVRTASGVVHRCGECGYMFVPWDMLERFSDDPARFKHLLQESQAFLLPTGRVCSVCNNRLSQGRIAQNDSILTFCTHCKTLWMEPWQLYEVDAAATRALQTQLQNPRVPVVPLPKATPPPTPRPVVPPVAPPTPPAQPTATPPPPAVPPVVPREPLGHRPLMPKMPSPNESFVPPIFAQSTPPPAEPPVELPTPPPAVPPPVVPPPAVPPVEPPKPRTGKVVWPSSNPVGDTPLVFPQNTPPPTTPPSLPIPPTPEPPAPTPDLPLEIKLPEREIHIPPPIPPKELAPLPPKPAPVKPVIKPPVIPKSFPVGPGKPRENIFVKVVNGAFGFLLGSGKSKTSSSKPPVETSMWNDAKDVLHEIWYAFVKGKPTKKVSVSVPKQPPPAAKPPTQARYMPAPKEEIRIPRIDSHFPKTEETLVTPSKPTPAPEPAATPPPAPEQRPTPVPEAPPVPPPAAAPPKKKSFLAALGKAIDDAWNPPAMKKSAETPKPELSKPQPASAAQPAPKPEPVQPAVPMPTPLTSTPAPNVEKPKKASNALTLIALWAPRVLPITFYLLIGMLQEEWGSAFIWATWIWSVSQIFRLIWLYPKSFRETTVESLLALPLPLKRGDTAVLLKGSLQIEGALLKLRDTTGEIALNVLGPLEVFPRILGLVSKGQYPEGEFTLSGWYRRGKTASIEVLEARDDKRPRKSLANGARWALTIAVFILSMLLYLAE